MAGGRVFGVVAVWALSFGLAWLKSSIVGATLGAFKLQADKNKLNKIKLLSLANLIKILYHRLLIICFTKPL